MTSMPLHGQVGAVGRRRKVTVGGKVMWIFNYRSNLISHSSQMKMEMTNFVRIGLSRGDRDNSGVWVVVEENIEGCSTKMVTTKNLLFVDPDSGIRPSPRKPFPNS